MAATAHTRVPRLEDLVGRSKRACAKRAWVAKGADVDEDTVLRWAKGQEPMPDDVIDWLAHSLAVSVLWLMRWEDAPRSEIPERWRQAIAEDGAQRCEQQLPHQCESLLHWIEWRLRVDADLADGESPLVPRLQRLRAAVLEYLSEPCEL